MYQSRTPPLRPVQDTLRECPSLGFLYQAEDTNGKTQLSGGHTCGDRFLDFPPGKQMRVRKFSLSPLWSDFWSSSPLQPPTTICTGKPFIPALHDDPAVALGTSRPCCLAPVLGSFIEIFFFLEISAVHFKAALLYLT